MLDWINPTAESNSQSTRISKNSKTSIERFWKARTTGFLKVHARKGTDRIVGATIVARHAGDLISEITLAMTHGLGLKKIGGTIHPYPTQADAIRKLGDQFNRTRLTPFVKSLFQKWLAWTR